MSDETELLAPYSTRIRVVDRSDRPAGGLRDFDIFTASVCGFVALAVVFVAVFVVLVVTGADR